MSETSGWDDYWSGSRSGVAFGSEGADHPALTRFWQETFRALSPDARVLDVAAGRGALLALLAEFVDLKQAVAVDFSSAALESLKERHPDVTTITSDVTELSIDQHTFDMVMSQYGVEYGGKSAIEGLPRYLADGGRLVLVIHSDSSVIGAECEQNLKALDALHESRFIEHAETMFQAGYDVVRGQIGRKEAAGAARRLLEPFHGLRHIMDEYGESVAGGTIQTLYRETARIQERFQYHEEAEVIGWLRTMASEVSTYRERMASMLRAAQSEAEITGIARGWQAQGLKVAAPDRILTEDGGVLGWVLNVVKP